MFVRFVILGWRHAEAFIAVDMEDSSGIFFPFVGFPIYGILRDSDVCKLESPSSRAPWKGTRGGSCAGRRLTGSPA